jgi:hypothetical protein
MISGMLNSFEPLKAPQYLPLNVRAAEYKGEATISQLYKKRPLTTAFPSRDDYL